MRFLSVNRPFAEDARLRLRQHLAHSDFCLVHFLSLFSLWYIAFERAAEGRYEKVAVLLDGNATNALSLVRGVEAR